MPGRGPFCFLRGTVSNIAAVVPKVDHKFKAFEGGRNSIVGFWCVIVNSFNCVCMGGGGYLWVLHVFFFLGKFGKLAPNYIVHAHRLWSCFALVDSVEYWSLPSLSLFVLLSFHQLSLCLGWVGVIVQYCGVQLPASPPSLYQASPQWVKTCQRVMWTDRMFWAIFRSNNVCKQQRVKIGSPLFVTEDLDSAPVRLQTGQCCVWIRKQPIDAKAWIRRKWCLLQVCSDPHSVLRLMQA